MSILSRLKNLFKVAVLLSTDDSGDIRTAMARYQGKVQKIVLWTPYGIMSHPPEDSILFVADQQAQASNGIGMADDPANRPLKDLEEGEFAVGNYMTGDYTKFDKDGNRLTVVSGNIISDATAHHLNGDTYSLTMWDDLNTQLQAFMTAYNAHTHGGSAPIVPHTLDLSGAEATTLKTDG